MVISSVFIYVIYAELRKKIVESGLEMRGVMNGHHAFGIRGDNFIQLCFRRI